MQPQGVRRVCRGRSSESVGAAFITWGPSEKMAAAHRDTAGLPGNARLDSDRASRSSRLSTAASGPFRPTSQGEGGSVHWALSQETPRGVRGPAGGGHQSPERPRQ